MGRDVTDGNDIEAAPSAAGSDAPRPRLRGAALVANLDAVAARRRKDLTPRLAPVLEACHAYQCVVVDLVALLGRTPPLDAQEGVCRDLIADGFDFLWEWEQRLLENRPHVAFPLGRRAYETTSLLSACMQSKSLAQKWASGKKMDNGEVRQALAKLPASENARDLKDLYEFFSEGSHPNRSLVGQRFLGEGNEFVLGSAARPHLILIMMHCQRLLELWFWFAACCISIRKELVQQDEPTLFEEYFAAAKQAQVSIEWAAAQIPRLIEEDAAEDALEQASRRAGRHDPSHEPGAR